MIQTPLLDAHLRVQPPSRLYHYTSIEGLIGILNSRVVWASGAEFLNDAREIHLAFDVAYGILLRRIASAETPALARLLTYYSEQFGRLETFTVCVFSLSEEGDLLSQWRGYCPSGGGYALGLPGPDLKAALTVKGFQLARCVYDPEQHEKLLSEAIDLFIGLVPQAEIPGEQTAFKSFAELWMPGLLHRVAQVAPLIKHHSFREECEWRIVWVPALGNADLRFRPARNMLIPYVEVGIVDEKGSMLPVDVVVGPMLHQKNAHEALTGYLMQSDVNWEHIHTSLTPYRSW